MKKVFLVLFLLWNPSSLYALILHDTFQSPIPNASMDLDYDLHTQSFWGVDNDHPTTTGLSVYNFDRSGNLITQWPTGGNFNLLAIAVDSPNNRVFYWKDLSHTLYETTLTGQIISQRTLSFNPSLNIRGMAYDQLAEHLVITWTNYEGEAGFIQYAPDTDEYLPRRLFDFNPYFEAGPYGFDLNQDFYYVLSYFGHILEINRQTLEVTNQYNTLPESSGLALDEDGNFYHMDFDGVIRHFIIPEPTTLLLLGMGAVMMRKKQD
jgi:hypothetical protein